MAAVKRYEIRLQPVQLSARGARQVVFSLMTKPPTREMEASRLQDILDRADAFAAEHGEACHIGIRCLDKRKPAGFDEATSYSRMFRNLDKARVDAPPF